MVTLLSKIHRNRRNFAVLSNSTYCNKWWHWKWESKPWVLFSSGTRSIASISSFLFSILEVQIHGRNSDTRKCWSSQWWEADESVLHEGEFSLCYQAVTSWVGAGASCKLLFWDTRAQQTFTDTILAIPLLPPQALAAVLMRWQKRIYGPLLGLWPFW